MGIPDTVRSVTQKVIVKMKENGGASHGPRAKKPIETEPTEKDVNHGWCMVVAAEVIAKFPLAEMAWVCDEHYGDKHHPVCHVMVRDNGVCYDAENPDGIPANEVPALLKNMEKVWEENGWE